jgi:putative phosphoesterase
MGLWGKLRRFGAIGDIHCEDEALEAALRLFEAHQVDAVLSVGDLLDGRGDPNRTLRLLDERRVIAIQGNHDRWYQDGEMRQLAEATPLGALAPDAAEFLASLPPTRDISTVSGQLLLCHGVGSDDMALLRSDDEGYALTSNFALQDILRSRRYRFVLGGHTHRRMVRQLGGVTFLNAGTLKHDDAPCALLVDAEALTASFFDLEDGRFDSAPQVHSLRD